MNELEGVSIMTCYVEASMTYEAACCQESRIHGQGGR